MDSHVINGCIKKLEAFSIGLLLQLKQYQLPGDDDIEEIQVDIEIIEFWVFSECTWLYAHFPLPLFLIKIP